MRKDRRPSVEIVSVPYWPEQWRGWYFTSSGHQLVSPDGDRFTPERLRGLGWRQAQEARAAAHRAREERVGEVVRGLWRNVARERREDGR